METSNALFKLCADDVYATFPKIKDEIFMNEVVRRMINVMVTDLISNSQKLIIQFDPSSVEEVRSIPPLIKFSTDIFESKQEIKTYLRKSLYEHKRVADMTNNAKSIIKVLFDYFMDDPKGIPENFTKDTRDDFPRIVSDYIAGMTDRFAIKLHSNIK